MIVCTMPGCQTTAGCLCRNRASMTAWRDQIAKDALILNIANPAYAAGRRAGLREAAEVVEMCAAEKDEDAASESDPDYRERYAVYAKHLRRAKDRILALAEGGEG
jgi:hypothetical protein